MEVLGIDIGGSGIKAAVVDTVAGRLVGERHRRETPSPATPAALVRTMSELVGACAWNGPVGVGFPGVVRHDVVYTAANLDASWVGLDLAALVREATGCPVSAINDADAAGLAEATFGAARDRPGTVLLLTLGTGIGSALFLDGRLVPNTELGHLEFRGDIAEAYAAASVRKAKDLRWTQWSKRLNRLLLHIDLLLSPDLIVLGGGVSAKFEKMAPHLDPSLRVVPAVMLNEAGIVGAALAAARKDLPANQGATTGKASRKSPRRRAKA
ncbi:ROK family protein [Opitutales bacterium ASA1]|uniref:polyphosphate--glucose phosphotransferase n=1 Tax=Congregicoccus parvus TaxID=3081749 RepID=UPI002B2BBF5F|nr:ROK family protein [Opitutales bacterium ASA1]